MKKLSIFGVFLVFMVAGIFFSGPSLKLSLENFLSPVEIEELLQASRMGIDEVRGTIAKRESVVPALKEELKSYLRIPYRSVMEKGKKFKKVILFLHGFSASPKEFSPLLETLSDEIQIPVLFARYSGHGQNSEELSKAKARDWFFETLLYYQYAKIVGDEIIVVGSSTGATLGYWLSQQNHVKLSHLILVSANFSPKDPRAEIALWPWGKEIALLLAGEERSWKAASEEQSRWWTTSYKNDVIFELMMLLKHVREEPIKPIQTKCALFYHPEDAVVSVKKMLHHFRALPCATSEIFDVSKKRPELFQAFSKHVLAGSAVAGPELTTLRLEEIKSFLK